MTIFSVGTYLVKREKRQRVRGIRRRVVSPYRTLNVENMESRHVSQQRSSILFYNPNPLGIDRTVLRKSYS